MLNKYNIDIGFGCLSIIIIIIIFPNLYRIQNTDAT